MTSLNTICGTTFLSKKFLCVMARGMGTNAYILYAQPEPCNNHVLQIKLIKHYYLNAGNLWMKLTETHFHFTEYSLLCKELPWISFQLVSNHPHSQKINSKSSLLTVATVTSENVYANCLYGSAVRNTEKKLLARSDLVLAEKLTRWPNRSFPSLISLSLLLLWGKITCQQNFHRKKYHS